MARRAHHGRLAPPPVVGPLARHGRRARRRLAPLRRSHRTPTGRRHRRCRARQRGRSPIPTARLRRRPRGRRHAGTRRVLPDRRHGRNRPARRPRLLGRRHRLAGGRRSDPRFRPSWSPETLLGANYLGRRFAIRRRVLLGLGGLREGLGDGRMVGRAAALRRRRRARRAESRASCRTSRRRPEAWVPTASTSSQAHLERIGAPAASRRRGGVVRIEWELEEWPHVTVVCRRDTTGRCSRVRCPSIAAPTTRASTWSSSTTAGAPTSNDQWYANVSYDLGLELDVEWWDEAFNYSAVNNSGARAAPRRGARVRQRRHRVPRAGVAARARRVGDRPDIGVVGLQLIGPDGTIQHGGVDARPQRLRRPPLPGHAPRSSSLLGPTAWYRNVLAVTGACLAIRRDCSRSSAASTSGSGSAAATSCSGLDAVLAGKRNVCSPFGGVRHLESATRGTTSRRGLLRELLALPALDLRRRPLLLAEPLARQPDPAAAARASSRRPPTASPSHSGARSSLPPVDRRAGVDLVAAAVRVTDADVDAIHTLHAHNVRAVRRRRRSTGSSPSSTARSTAASTPRSASPTTWRGCTASRTASCSGPIRTTGSTARRSRRRSPRSPTRRSTTTCRSRRGGDPGVRRRDLDAVGRRRTRVAHFANARRGSST